MLPISFTKYYVKNNKLYCEIGLFSTERNEIMDMLSQLVEEQRAKNKVRVGEVMREDDTIEESSLNG